MVIWWLRSGSSSRDIGDALVLLRVTSGLQTWLVGLLQILHPCCRQGEFLVHVF